MKKAIVVLMLACVYGGAYAQFFSQKSAQLRRLGEQVVALKAYGEVLWKGYKAANTGLGTIRDIKNGDFKLHDLFFRELVQVNPNIRRYAQAGRMVALQVETIRIAAKGLRMIKTGGRYNEDDLLFFQRLFEDIVSSCKRILDEFSNVCRDGELKLTDDERVHRIDHLYARMLKNYQDVKVIAEEIKFAEMNSEQEGEDILRMRRLYKNAD